MPIYEYECLECGHKFSRLAKMDDPNPPCPEETETPTIADKVCGCATKRIVSKSAFHLKEGGCGWADDGYSS